MANTDVDLSQLMIERDQPRTRKNRPQRHLLTRYLLPGLLLAGFLGIVVWSAFDFVFPPRPVTVIPVVARQSASQPAGAPLFKAAGWIEPRPTPVRVAALAPGVVERLLVVEDQQVEKNEPIAELVKVDSELLHKRALADERLREAELEEAQAALLAATARLEQPVHLEAELGEAEATLAKVETELSNLPFESRRAEAKREFARKNHAQKSSLQNSGAVSGRVVAEARSNFESAQALVEELTGRAKSLKKQHAALVNRRNALRKQLELRIDETRGKQEAEARVKSAQARLAQVRVAVDESALRVKRMTVRAPIAGRVLQLVASPGTRLMAGRGPAGSHDGSTVVTLYRPEMLQVRVDVRFDDLPRVGLHQPVRIESPAVPAPLHGKVLFLGASADIQKNTLEVKVAIENSPSVLKPEMLVNVTFLASQQQQPSTPSVELKLFVPRQHVEESETDPFVWVADQSAGVARRVPIELGPAGADGLIEVTSGLTNGSRIIASETETLRDGDRIRILGDAE